MKLKYRKKTNRSVRWLSDLYDIKPNVLAEEL